MKIKNNLVSAVPGIFLLGLAWNNIKELETRHLRLLRLASQCFFLACLRTSPYYFFVYLLWSQPLLQKFSDSSFRRSVLFPYVSLLAKENFIHDSFQLHFKSGQIKQTNKLTLALLNKTQLIFFQEQLSHKPEKQKEDEDDHTPSQEDDYTQQKKE
jgi:hypothetical protein